MHIHIYKEIQKLDYIFELVSKIEDEELKSHWSRYLCVLVSGLIENSLRISLYNFLSVRCNESVIKYLEHHLSRITNVNCKKIEDVLNLFNKEWGKLFCELLEDKEKSAIDSIINNRNHIAHGDSVGLSFVIMKDYYYNTKTAISHFEKILIN